MAKEEDDKKPVEPKPAAKKRSPKKIPVKKIPDNTDCQNCGAVLMGEHCHQCGQAAKEPRRVFIGLVQDVFVDTLAIDGKLARSISLLLWRPGVLARRFLDGRRVYYSPPFRLYLFASVFFFFAAFLFIDLPNGVTIDDAVNADPADVSEAKDEIEDARKRIKEAKARAVPETVSEAAPKTSQETAREAGDESVDVEDDAKEEKGSSIKTATWEETDYNGPDWLEPHLQRLFEAAQRVSDDPRLFASEAQNNVPRFLLLAPVIYGLTLALLYSYRRSIFIYDHFIVSLYMHAALYAYLLLALLLSKVPIVGGWIWFVPLLWGALQPLLVLRQAYRSNWLSVWIKWAISNVIYLISFVLIITLGLSYSLYLS